LFLCCSDPALTEDNSLHDSVIRGSLVQPQGAVDESIISDVYA
jgi:hypothetical protein